MIDFDAKFHDYYEQWIKQNAGKYNYAEMEDKVPEVYAEWLNTYDADLSDSPANYLKGLSSDALLELFRRAFTEGREPASALTDEIESREDCVASLKGVLAEKCDAEIKMHVSNMLLEAGMAGECIDVFSDWVLEVDFDSELRDVAVEILKDYAGDVYEKLINAAENADNNTKTLIAEVIINASKNDKTFKLLEELFKSGKNTALYAGYLGKYGDERAAEMLYRALDNCNYLEFTEIRNAIEVLGGVVDEDYRDFSDDEYYKAIKHLK